MDDSTAGPVDPDDERAKDSGSESAVRPAADAGLDPDVIAFLDGAPIPGMSGAPTGPGAPASPSSGAALDGPAALGADDGEADDGEADGAGAGRHHARASWGVAVTMTVVIVAAALLDPSGLAAPVAWTGARPGWQPWTWLQYAVLAPLIVALAWWWTRRLLAGATPAAPRGWVVSRVWLVVILAMMVAKLVYSVLLMAPALAGGSGAGLPPGPSAAYLVWATGFTGIKASMLGWIPAIVAALLWHPTAARRAGVSALAPEPSRALLPAAGVALVLAVVGGWLAGYWWTGSPVGYAHSSGWKLLAPTSAAGRAGEVAAILIVAGLLARSARHTLRRVQVPRGSAPRLLAGALGALAAGIGLALVESFVQLLFGTDVAGSDDLWILPSTYLRLAEGMSFGLLLAPVAALGFWLVARAPRPQWSWAFGLAAAAVGVGAVFIVVRQTEAYSGVPPLAGSDPAPVELPPQLVAVPDEPAPPGPITARRDDDGSAVLADQRGAQVILRGINVNQLGDYYAADPEVPTVEPLTEQDFADIAAMGFNAVRLVLSWSALEPEPGQIDVREIDRAKQAVAWAREHGIHIVLDMHQDAWAKGVVAPPDAQCRAGTTPMTGWDGAPEWASHYDDAPACQFTGRDLAPNVLRGFTSFYYDRDEARDHLIAVWGRLAREFAGDPTVVGYDLLNEPSFAEQAPLTSGMLLGSYHARAIQAIRAGEQTVPGGYPHPIFLEPSIWWSGFGVDPLPPRGFTADSQVVFSPHLYNESITMDQSVGMTTVSIERGYALAARAAAGWGTPLWVGEWGFFDGDASLPSGQTGQRTARSAAAEDQLRIGSAAWVWKQGCGDPHHYPSTEAGGIRRVACPQGTPLKTQSVRYAPLSRAYPRTAPGRLLAIESDGRRVQVDGTTSGVGPVDGLPDECALDIWVPGTTQPTVVDSYGVTDLRSVEVPEGSAWQDPSGGWRVIGCATGDYRVTLS